jgi:hypothetical protein
MNTTHDIHTEIDTTALFHNMEVPHGCYCQNINKSYAFSLASSLKLTDVILTAIYMYYHMDVSQNQPEISTFREKRRKETPNKANQHADLQIFSNVLCWPRDTNSLPDIRGSSDGHT